MVIKVGTPANDCIEFEQTANLSADRVKFDFGGGPSGTYTGSPDVSGVSSVVSLNADYAISFNFEFGDVARVILSDGANQTFMINKAPINGANIHLW